MWRYNDTPDNELMHYGVLGMKWGIRRDRGRAYTKAKKKMDKLDQKAEKAVQKKEKRSKPLIRTSISDARYATSVRKADKAITKAAKWYKKVEQNFGTEDAQRMTNSPGYHLGREYADRFMTKRK